MHALTLNFDATHANGTKIGGSLPAREARSKELEGETSK